MDAVRKITSLKNEVEAQILKSELTERNIPHVIISYFDSAFDGLFQVQRGWGHIEAPERFAGEIIEVLESIRSSSLEEDESESEQ